MDFGFLRSHPLTFGLQASQLKHLSTLLQEVRAQTGEQLLREGVPTRGLLIVAEGKLRISHKTAGGDAGTLAELEAPTVIGEMELVSGQPSAATVTANTDVLAYLLTHDAFAELVEAGDAAVSKLIRNIARVLVLRIQETNKRLLARAEPKSPGEFDTFKKNLITNWNF